MQLRKWNELPKFMRTREVRKYYNIVNKRRASLMVKRLFDIVVASIMLAVLALPMLIIAILIKCDSRGPVFFRQERVTQYGRIFKIYKFRTSGRTSLPAFRPPASGRSHTPACSGLGQPSARQLRTAACGSVPDRRSHRCRAASFPQTSVS